MRRTQFSLNNQPINSGITTTDSNQVIKMKNKNKKMVTSFYQTTGIKSPPGVKSTAYQSFHIAGGKTSIFERNSAVNYDQSNTSMADGAGGADTSRVHDYYSAVSGGLEDSAAGR